jgi:hypothetical protein
MPGIGKLSPTISAKPDGVGAVPQPWIPMGERFGLPTYIATMESVSLCVPIRSLLRLWNWNQRFASQRPTQLVTKPLLNNTSSKSFFEKITCLPNQMSLFLCQIITTEGPSLFRRLDQLKLLITVR